MPFICIQFFFTLEDNDSSKTQLNEKSDNDQSEGGLTKFVKDVEHRKSQQKLHEVSTEKLQASNEKLQASNEKLEVVAAKANEDTTLNINTRKTLEKFLGKKRRSSTSESKTISSTCTTSSVSSWEVNKSSSQVHVSLH